MDAPRAREVLVAGIDRIMGMSRLFGPTAEERAVLLACRAEIISNDEVVARIAQRVGPYKEGEVMPKPKTMTLQQIQATDWASLLAKLPALAALIAQIIDLLASEQAAPKAAGPKGSCPHDVHERLHEALATLAAHVCASLRLHESIECCDES